MQPVRVTVFMKSLILLFGAVLFFTSLEIDAGAFCSTPNQTVAEELKDSVAVFIGRVVRIRKAPKLCPDPGWTYSLKVKKVFRGNLGDHVEVSTENNSGRLPLEMGRDYLLFVKESCGPLMIYGGCGHSAPAERAKSVVRELETVTNSSERAGSRVQRTASPAATTGSLKSAMSG